MDGSNLVILVTKLSPEIENYYMSACETKDKIIFRQVPYSYEYLLSIEEKAIMETESKANVYEYYVDIKTNTINIGVDKIYDVDSSKISSFPIVLYKTENIPKLTAMRGGEIITSIKSCSICFFGTYNGKASLITCGHSNIPILKLMKILKLKGSLQLADHQLLLLEIAEDVLYIPQLLV